MVVTRLRIFISSVQKEFAQARTDLKAFLLGDAVLRRFVSEVFLFEELPAKDQRADQAYLNEVNNCDIYLGIFGYQYGRVDRSGLSATEQEYNCATKVNKTRLIYIWGADDKKRDPKMQQFVKRAGQELIRRRIDDGSALTGEVYASLIDYLDNLGALRVPPFDTAVCEGASLANLSRKRIEWFLDVARRERGFPLTPKTETRALLTHLNLLAHRKPTNAAMLLFGSNPQRFFRVADTKCIHCHGTEYRRPFASLQVYGGDLFEQADQARDFVLAKINRAIGSRGKSNRAQASYELPVEAVDEAIINAIAHRDYNSNAAVEVRLFADRLEVWNPGSLPGTLTIESLRTDHASVPYNPLLAEPLYLARYIERVGSGTQTMFRVCREAGLPEPDFEQRAGFFVVTLWRNWLTDEVLAKLNLNDRQQRVMSLIQQERRLTNRRYQIISGATRSTAKRDLEELVKKGVLTLVGSGRGAYYEFVKKGAKNGSKGSSV